MIVTDFGEGLKIGSFLRLNCPQKSDFLKKSDFLSPLKCFPKINWEFDQILSNLSTEIRFFEKIGFVEPQINQ
jgi:hypothetical protein